MATSNNLQLSMSSKKQHIRLWYECLQICHSDPQYKNNLKNSASFYEEWGDVVGLKFDHWWKEKNFLFKGVREVQRASKNPNELTISVPLNESISTILKDVRKIVEIRQSEMLIDKGMDPSKLKSKKVGLGKYSFTQKELKGKFHYINLEMYKIYLRLNKPPINRTFLIQIRRAFDGRKRSLLSKNIVYIPTIQQLQNEALDSNSVIDPIRTVRRGIKGVEKTLLNVSNGKFP